ncbi:uncharacterized protein LOC135496306 isoform X2 [Lineus longissimus]|uniref:uncharacterized protein LOC135496306 isoform X2 n=1 Tax=Lineus longissimus TaxID=88925 RepID=UPI002B4C84EC
MDRDVIPPPPGFGIDQDGLSKAVLQLDNRRVRQILDSGVSPKCVNEENETLLHQLIKQTNQHTLLRHKNLRQLVCMLRHAGIDINHRDQDGNTALHLALIHLPECQDLGEVLLQGGADPYINNKEGLAPEDLILSQKIPDDGKQSYQKYLPGLWKAVEMDSIMSVRKLINLWCRVDLHRGDKTLMHLALEKGTENIIRIIKEIGPSMELAHSVLAADVKSTKMLCNSCKNINTEFKNLGENGATPLFYAIRQNNHELVDTLRAKGARVETTIIVEEEMDMPIFFSALQSSTSPEVIQRLIPTEKDYISMAQLRFKGKLPLFSCIENDVNFESVKVIIEQGPAELITSRNEFTLTPRDVAEEHRKLQYMDVIDEYVHAKCFCDDPSYRMTLALQGYDRILDAMKEGLTVLERRHQDPSVSAEAIEFIDNLLLYQDHVQDFHAAVEDSDLETTRRLLLFDNQELQNTFKCCMTDSRALCDPQPPLHKAVLRRNHDMVAYLAQSHLKFAKTKLDESRDQCYRTALHYAYGLADEKCIPNMLLDLGASEFTMDKDGRSPLSFRDKRKSTMMKNHIKMHLKKDFSMEDPALWKPTSLYLHYVNCPNATKNQLGSGSDTEYAEEGEYDYDADDYTDGEDDAYDDEEEVPVDGMREYPSSNSYCSIL